MDILPPRVREAIVSGCNLTVGNVDGCFCAELTSDTILVIVSRDTPEAAIIALETKLSTINQPKDKV